VTETEAVERASEPRWLLTIGGALGLIAAVVLTIDKIELLKNKDKQFSCDINAFVSCAGVMGSKQAEAFGFANSIIGIGGFAVVLTLGVLLLARVELPSFAWVGLWFGTLFGISFVTWLQYQSIYNIGKLCPYCMLVWAVMIPIFVAVSARNLRTFHPGNALSRFVNNWTVLIVLLWYVAVIAAIWFKFGSALWA